MASSNSYASSNKNYVREAEVKLRKVKSQFLNYDHKLQLALSIVVGLASSFLIKWAKSYILFGLIAICLVLLNTGLKREKMREKYSEVKRAAAKNKYANQAMEYVKHFRNFMEENLTITLGFVIGVLLGLRFL